MNPRFTLHVLFLLCAGTTAHAQQLPLMRDFIGINIKGQTHWQKANRFSNIRDLHSWSEDFPAPTAVDCPFESSTFQDKLRWSPSYNVNKFIDYAAIYRAMPQQVVPMLQGPATAMYGTSWSAPDFKSKALCRTSSTGNVVDPFYQFLEQKDALAYRPFAIWASLFATKFGATSSKPFGFEPIYESMVAESASQWNEGTIDFIEVHNEPDASWNSPEGWFINLDQAGPDAVNLAYLNQPLTHYYYLPEQYAAMLSAVYDGGNRSKGFDIQGINGFWGIKNLSPYTKVVVGGSVDFRTTYWQEVVDKCLQMPERAGAPLPFDVMNYHFYAQLNQPAMSNASAFPFYEQGIKYPPNDAQNTNRGVHPEHPNITLRERVKNLISSPNNALVPRTIPWWLTEMGYDTKSSYSFVRIDPFAGLNKETIHGQWLTRYFLEVAAAVVAGKSIDKVYIYELDDNNTSSEGYFETSGLMTDKDMPKRSWFHIQTLKNTLNSYRFDPSLPIDEPNRPTFTTSAGVLPLDNPRIYRFENGVPTGNPNDQDIYVLWAPNAENTKYQGTLKIKNYTLPKPVVRLTTIDETDEDGRKIVISPTKVNIVNGDLVIEDLHVSETPIYLELNPVKPSSDPDQLRVISSLAATCLDCAGNVALSWALPVDLNNPALLDISAYYNIYYADAALYDSDPLTAGNQSNPAVFNSNSAHILAYQVPGGATSAYVQNMLQAGHTYYFWVIPFVETNGSSNGFQSGFGTKINLESGIHFTIIDLATCTTQTCATSITSAMISNINPTGFSSGVVAMSTGNVTQYCTNIAAPSLPALLDFSYGPTQLSWEIDLGDPKHINAIHLFQSHGTGNIKVEIKEDCYPGWRFIGLYDLNKYQYWHIFSNGLLNSRKVEKIRFTLTRLPGSSVGLGNMYFCTTPATNACLIEPISSRPCEGDGKGMTTFSERSVFTKDIKTQSAYVSFLPARELLEKQLDKEENRLKMVPIYNISYSIAKGIDGKLLDPLTTQIDAKGYTHWQNIPIANLHPDTEYFVEIEPDRTSLTGGCGALVKPQSLSFRTLPLEKIRERSNTQISLTTHEITLTPIPANNQITFQFEPGVFDRYAIINTAGATVLEGAIDPSEAQKQVQFELSAGWYVLQCFGGKATGTKAFVVVK